MTRNEKDRQIEKVVRNHHSGLRYFIRALGVNQAWVDDLAQEAFLVAHRKWDELDDPENAGMWLRKIARNLVMNELTKSGRRQRLLDEKVSGLLIETESSDPAPGVIEDREIRHDALRECLGKLPRHVRQIVDARYYHDKRAGDIGEEMSMSPAAVRKALFLARKTLAGCLAAKSVHSFQ
ncbi:sigma-70 family RNA polymerase sigma factor [Luteolibacter marinus]|uniref:sigma-70 family RNA polymerase sigma factor n=1 Tax=Luteolibacter marinus TaxID=2776705 RepID=UPI001865FB07|nr:sigma-70 family RNA polymerase sigma factor [Luteolibacter marinus]